MPKRESKLQDAIDERGHHVLRCPEGGTCCPVVDFSRMTEDKIVISDDYGSSIEMTVANFKAFVDQAQGVTL